MRSTTRLLILTLLLAPLLAACGEDAESAAALPAPAAEQTGDDPWAEIPPDSLYGATAPENVRVTPVVLDLPDLPAAWDGVRIAAISDLQLGLWEDNERVAAAAVQRAVEENPDLIVLLGDYLAGGAADTAALARVLAPLRGKNVVAVLGDRDIRSDSLEAQVIRALRGQEIRVLENEAITFQRNGEALRIGGLDPEILDESWGDQEWILSTLGGSGDVDLLLTHNPALATRAPNGRFGAVLAGNTFCGDVEVPGSPRLSWVNSEALPGAVVPETERLYRVKGSTMFITCGTGYSFVPVRFGAQPEVALVTLQGMGAGGAAAPAAPDSVTAADSLLQQYEQERAASDTTG